MTFKDNVVSFEIFKYFVALHFLSELIDKNLDLVIYSFIAIYLNIEVLLCLQLFPRGCDVFLLLILDLKCSSKIVLLSTFLLLPSDMSDSTYILQVFYVLLVFYKMSSCLLENRFLGKRQLPLMCRQSYRCVV